MLSCGVSSDSTVPGERPGADTYAAAHLQASSYLLGHYVGLGLLSSSFFRLTLFVAPPNTQCWSH